MNFMRDFRGEISCFFEKDSRGYKIEKIRKYTPERYIKEFLRKNQNSFSC